MGEAIGQILPFAVGVAISPIPIVAVILMLFSRRAKVNASAFAIGWIVGLAVVAGVAVVVGLEGSDGDQGGVIRVVIGVALLALAARQWRARPGPDDEAPLPPWMATIDEFTPARSFGLAVLLSGVNPKNLGLTIAASTTVSGFALEASDEVVVVAVYVLLASLTIVVPVVASLVAGDRLAPFLDAAKAWLVANNATVMSVLFVVFGAKVLGDGITSLS